MRRCLQALAIFFGAGALWSGVAWAGHRAIYLDPDREKVVIEITDDGNAVVRPEGKQQYGVLRDGEFYLVAKEEGVWHVARMKDLAAAFDRVMPPIFKQIFDRVGQEKPKSKLRIEPAGKRTVAGIRGQLYRVYGLSEGKPDKASLFVLSNDVALQPVGRAMEQFLIASLVAMTPLLGDMAADMTGDLQAIFRNGAPLDMEDRFRLVSLETISVPPSAAALPAAPETVDQIVAQIKTRNSGTPQAPEE